MDKFRIYNICNNSNVGGVPTYNYLNYIYKHPSICRVYLMVPS